MAPTTKWGILSSGLISSDFTNALTSCDRKAEHTVVAVSARDVKRAKEFADKFGIPKAYGSEEELAADPEIEVVYIGNINTSHITSVKAMLNAGKNVLCEKPMGLNSKQMKEMIALAKAKKLFLMEAVWTRFNPAILHFLDEIHVKKSVGDILHSRVDMGRYLPAERMHKRALGGGTVLDLGIYCITFSSLVFNDERPIKISAQGMINDDGVDIVTAVIFTYSGGRTAMFTTTSMCSTPCKGHVFGTKGMAEVGFPFWTPLEITTPDGSKPDGDGIVRGVKTFKLPESKIPYNFDNSAALAFEANHVRDCLLKGLKESPVLSFAKMTQVAEISDEIRKQLGVSFPQDEE